MNKKNTYSPKDIEMLCPECGTPIEKGSYMCTNCKLKISLAKKSIKAKKIVKLKKAVEPKPEKKEESAETSDKAKDKEIVEEEVEKEGVIKIVDATETTETDKEEIVEKENDIYKEITEAEEYFKSTEDTDKNN